MGRQCARKNTRKGTEMRTHAQAGETASGERRNHGGEGMKYEDEEAGIEKTQQKEINNPLRSSSPAAPPLSQREAKKTSTGKCEKKPRPPNPLGGKRGHAASLRCVFSIGFFSLSVDVPFFANLSCFTSSASLSDRFLGAFALRAVVAVIAKSV